MPARIILPATGASTWALGSHRCVRYIGILTKKASKQNNHHVSWSIGVELIEGETSVGHIIFVVSISLFMRRILVRSGRDAVVVYSMRYILACSRSG